jgi:hypothetical protein
MNNIKIIPSIAVSTGYKITCTDYFTKEISAYIINDYDYANIQYIPFLKRLELVKTFKDQKTTY